MSRDFSFGLKFVAIFVVIALGVRYYLDWKDKQNAQIAKLADSGIL